MYMRLFQIKIKPEKLPELRQFYETKVIPALQNLPGCRHASLIHGVHHEDECISLTLWDSRGNAEAYAQSGLFRLLFQAGQPFLADSSEWKIQLSDDLKLEYVPVPEEPVVKSYGVDAATDTKALPEAQSAFMYLRIVSVQIKPGKLEEFRRLYAEEIIPALRGVPGCRYAFLTESLEAQNEVISVTIWDTRQEAENYEQSGLFDQLTQKVKHTFSELYQWKMALEQAHRGQAATSEDLTVKHYSVVTGKSFAPTEKVK
ncbi:antibiotic biosynthesis monooxygenase [candidate division KSB1 bacterium]|nr:antibiotic biosynthesis monooxygenase [candidate division KSB1 bacterium]